MVEPGDRLHDRALLLRAALRILPWLPLVVVFALLPAVPTQLRALDFAAFYCGGQVLRDHGDPYRAGPLGECERALARNGPIGAGAILPAPLPPYALAAVAPITTLPFTPAQVILDLASFAALILAGVFLVRLTGLSAPIVAYALAPQAWIVVALGQPVLLALAALTTTAALLRARRDELGALAAATMMFEPHLGLPVCAALFLWRPRTRLTLLAAAAVVAAMSTFVVPWNLTVEYFRDVLPLHTLSEARGAAQISLTGALTFFGFPDAIAVRAGTAQYALAVAAALLFARRMNDGADLVFASVLGALVGGSFLHVDDLLLAIPAALMLWRNRPATACLAVIALSPHVPGVGGAIGALLSIVSTGVLVGSLRSPLRGALAAVALGAFLAVAPPVPITPRHLALASPPFDAYAQASWSQWESLTPRNATWPISVAFAWLTVLAIAAGMFTASAATIKEKATPSGQQPALRPDGVA